MIQTSFPIYTTFFHLFFRDIYSDEILRFVTRKIPKKSVYYTKYIRFLHSYKNKRSNFLSVSTSAVTFTHTSRI